MMNGALAIVRKELKTNLWSFQSFLLFSLFSLATGLFFFANVHDFSAISREIQGSRLIPVDFTQAVIGPFFMNACLVLLLTIPILTMKTFSEERKLGTFELLFTYPVSDFQIVLGKWLALMIHLTGFLVPTVFYFALLHVWKGGFEIPVILVAYLGLSLVASITTTFGMLISSLTENQLVSAAISFLVIALFWTIGWTGDLAGSVFSGVSREFWALEHMREFSRGVLDTKYVAFYLIGTGFFFFATVLSLESRAWRR